MGILKDDPFAIGGAGPMPGTFTHDFAILSVI
jgi:hypothetical protein